MTVELRGGELEIEWAGRDASVFMTGPAAEVFTGRVPLGDAGAPGGADPGEGG